LPEARLRNGTGLGLPEKLEAATHQALDKLVEIISEPIHRIEEDYVPLARIQSDASKTIVTTQVRTDEARFRARQGDQLQALLEMVARRQAEKAMQSS
jgi:hypothetical protein